jgi:hypothetical protein
MAARDLITPDKMTGPELLDLQTEHWDVMKMTRANAADERRLINGEIKAQFPENFTVAGAEHYRADSLQKYMVPQRVFQDIVADRPRLSIPLGPKGLGLSAQRLTTKVEQPLNAIVEHPDKGYAWNDMAGLILFEGFGVGITVIDPADWEKKPSPWVDPTVERDEDRVWKKRYRVDEQGRTEDDLEEGETFDLNETKAKELHNGDLDLFRASHLPVYHRALSIMDCAPMFGPNRSVEGLIVEQDFSVSALKREFDFGPGGLLTPTGGNTQTDGQASGQNRAAGHMLTKVEAWLYDEEGMPYVSYLVKDKGKGGKVYDTRWKKNGEVCTIDLNKMFGMTRLPIDWQWGLQWAGARNPDQLALPFTKPYRGNWLTADWLKTCLNVSMLWVGFPALLIQRDPNGRPDLGGLDGKEEAKPPVVVMPMTMTEVDGPVTNIGGQAVSRDVMDAIRMNLGEVEDAAPGGDKGGGSSGFAMSLEGAYDKIALTTVRQALGKSYEAHGSFVLEAGKSLPELGRKRGSKQKYPPILVYRATDVPTNDKADDRHEPIELDPELIDETYTCKALYPKSLSLPEKQQSMEEVERRLKTRRKHLEDTGDLAPETTEAELRLEDQRARPEYAALLDELTAQVQGAEEAEKIAKAQAEGLANETQGMPAGMNAGVGPELPPGMISPQDPGAMVPGVPVDGSVTGFGGPTTGQAVLAGAVGGAGMGGPINNAAAAGGEIPPNLVTPGVV